MDSEDFIVDRREIVARMEERRSRDVSSYPFQMGAGFGFQLPGWLRMALSFAPRGGLVSSLMQISLPLVAPFLLKKQIPLLSRLLTRFYPSKF
jgi:hypothetical protein